MKKYSVVYNSPTGNTAKLAEKLREILPSDGCVYFGSPSAQEEEIADSEVVFLGFWTLRRDADTETKQFLPRLKDKKVYLFGTAGFASSGEYYDEILGRVKQQLPDSAEYLGGFLCAGKMPQETCLKYRAALMEHPNNVKIMRMIDNFDRAATHPDENDLIHFASAVQKLSDEGKL